MFDAGDILKKAALVGHSYGFTPLSSLLGKRDLRTQQKKQTASKAKQSIEKEPVPVDTKTKEVHSFFSHLLQGGILPTREQPLFLWHSNASFGRRAPKVLTLQFHAIGAARALSDAVLIRAMRSLVGECAKNNPVVKINSMGDKETRGRFTRELGSFFKKHGDVLSDECLTCAKQDVYEAAQLLGSESSPVSAPSPVDHLSEQSRKHFESVLEYLEATDIPYELTPSLYSKAPTWSETCFSIEGDQGVSVWGSRYAEYTKQFFKSAIPGIGAIVEIETENRDIIAPSRNAPQSRFVFVHIGDEAKRESMRMTDELRHARIPITQAVGVESLAEQMRIAENSNSPYLLIMGRKEALERSVILRERSTYNETIIPLDSLVSHLKTVA